MAWIIGPASGNEMAEIQSRGWPVEPVTPDFLKGLLKREPDDTDDLVAVYVDSDVLEVLTPENWFPKGGSK